MFFYKGSEMLFQMMFSTKKIIKGVLVW